MVEYPDPDTRNVLEPGCARCPALAESRERIAWGNGPRDADVLVVGEAPGAGHGPPGTDAGDQPRAEATAADRWLGGNWTGLAYTSRHSGRRIRRLLADAGVPDAYYTNAVKCFPSDGTGSNREPTDPELRNCREHLLTEIETVAPAVVVATGKHATTSLLAAEGRSLESFLDAVLEPIDCPALGVTCLPILHPSYQAVWLARLGYEREEYVAAIAEWIDRLR